MLIPLISPLVLITQTTGPVARIRDIAISVPVFSYPNLLRLNKIQGDFTFRITVVSGSVQVVEHTSVGSRRLLPHLSSDLEKQLRSIQFKPAFSGQMDLLIKLRLNGPDKYPDGTTSKVTITPESNIIQIETNPAKVTVDDAPPR